MSSRMLPYESHSNPGGFSDDGDGRTSSCVGASPLGHRSIMNRPWSWCWCSEDFVSAGKALGTNVTISDLACC